jgi:hypothetical protein
VHTTGDGTKQWFIFDVNYFPGFKKTENVRKDVESLFMQKISEIKDFSK